MRDEKGWYELCARLAEEKDPVRLLELVKEMDRWLREADAKDGGKCGTPTSDC
jgi:hypothetical protein